MQRCFTVFVFAGISVLFCKPVVSSERRSLDDERIDELITLLGDSSFANRTASEKKLLEFGESALVKLTAAAKIHDSLEVRVRARNLIKKIIDGSLRSRSLGTKFSFLKRGEFSMGSDPSESKRRNDEQLHKVTISSPFMIGISEVTQSEYKSVMKLSPSWFSKEGQGKAKIKTATENYPVDSVSWFDALDFCNRLSERDKFPPFYSLTEIKREENSIVGAKVKVLGGFGYRLPTEAEWEYACRAGTKTAFNLGKKSNQGNFQYRRDSYGGTTNIALGRTTDVGKYKPNQWGLFDMHGNVAEWCWDIYDKDYYANSPIVDPMGPGSGDYRVLRGGSFLVNKTRCRSASRFWSFPGEGKFYTGFRIARTPSKVFVDAFEVK